MATLKHVQDSQRQQDSVGVIDSIVFIPDAPIDSEPVTMARQYVVFKLVSRSKRMYIDGICHDVINPETKKPDTIWLIRGTHSIWESELKEVVKDIDKPNSRINKNRESLYFEDGICRIPVSEVRKLEFARLHKHNVGKNRNGAGKYDFYEYDPQEEQRMRLEKQMSKIKLIQMISTMEDTQMKKLAFWFNVNPNDDLGLPKGIDGIRDELLLIAETRPDHVKKYIGSKEVEVAYLVRKAIIDAKIDLTAQQGNAMWAGGNGFICKIPTARKAHEYLTEFAMTNSDEGRMFLEQLKTIVT